MGIIKKKSCKKCLSQSNATKHISIEKSLVDFRDETSCNSNAAHTEHNPSELFEIGVAFDANRLGRFDFDDSARVIAQTAWILLDDLASALVELSLQLDDAHGLDERLVVQQHGISNGDVHLYIEHHDSNLEPSRNRDDVVHVTQNASHGNVGHIHTGQLHRNLIAGER